MSQAVDVAAGLQWRIERRNKLSPITVIDEASEMIERSAKNFNGDTAKMLCFIAKSKVLMQMVAEDLLKENRELRRELMERAKGEIPVGM